MFLDKRYVLGNELAEIGNFHIANISMIVKKFHDNDNYSDAKNLGNCTFINSDAELPKHIIKLLHKCTPMNNKLPMTYLTKELKLNKDKILLALKDYITSTERIGGKEFVVFTDEFVQIFKDKVHYVLNKSETDEALKNDYIDGFIQLSRNNFLVWY